VLKKSSFKTGDVPADLVEKREKLATRAEKKKEESAKPKTVNKSALAKKIEAQLDGLDLLEKLTLDVTRIGLGSMNPKTAHEVEDKAKEAGNAVVPGAQAASHRYPKLFNDDGGINPKAGGKKGEAVFSEALDELSRLHSIVKQGRAYLQRRLDDPDLKPETE